MQYRRLALIVTTLYVAEGLPFGVVNELVPVWLKDRGTGLAEIGLVSLVGLPWTLKALWAPLVDRHGAAAHWIGSALFVVALGCTVLPWSDRSWWLWTVLMAMAMASATQDIAIDGYVTAITPDAQLGRVNGIRVAGYRGAMLLAGGGAVTLAAFVPWSTVFALVGLAAAGLGLLLVHVQDRPRASPQLRPWVAQLFGWIARDGWLSLAALVAFVVTFKIGDAAMAPMVKPFWIDAGLGLKEVGLISITLGTALSVGGALVGGELTTRIGILPALVVLGALQAGSNLVYALVALEPLRALVYAASMFESFTAGLGTAAYLAFLMRACGREQTATRFALLTSLAGLTRTLAMAASGVGVETLGYPAYFAATFLLALPAFLLIPIIKRRLAG